MSSLFVDDCGRCWKLCTFAPQNDALNQRQKEAVDA